MAAFQFGKTAFDVKAQQQAVNATTLSYNQLIQATQGATGASVAFTDATGRGRITLENFGNTFDNATRKVLVWQFAIMAVYGTIRKVSETIQTWKDLEVTLTRVSITTGALGSQLQQYFKQVADVAIQFGMPIEQTLTGMDLALRATARYSEQANRGAIAVDLLSSASALANITGMQYSQSIDILVGSLRQSGMELDDGVKLLDKWVAVAKNAAVSVNDLSQGFAIMADAGRAAGLTVDQINGLIASLSETVTLGPVQIGNAIRALMSTLYNQSSISLLQKYGVAVRDTSGEVRSFWEVMTQLSSIKLAGVLDESAWLEIAKAAGAGQRRYAQFLALLNNFTTAMRVANISATAEGEAMEANRKIVETLTNTWDKFTAAQRKFLFLMGEQMGTIGDLTGALQGLTNFFNQLSETSDGVYKLGRSVMFLVGTLGALKIASLAMQWTGIGAIAAGGFAVGPRLGAAMGRFGGVGAAQVTGSAASMKAVQQMKTMIAAQGLSRVAATQALEAQVAAGGIGMMAPGVAARAGGAGLLSLLTFGRFGGGARMAPGGGAPGYYQGRGQYGPIYHKGIPERLAPTWGGVGRGLTQPMGGMGRTIGGLGLGAAAYGLTGEWQSAAGAGIGAAIGGAFGPVGMAIGAGIGTLIGHTAADAFISQEDRLEAIFQGMAEDFTLDLSDVMDKYFGQAVKGSAEDARRAAGLVAPQFPEARIAEAQPFWKRLLSGVQIGGIPFGQRTPSGEGAFAPFGRPGEKEWKEGLGGLRELKQALDDGVITADEYNKARKKDHIAWQELTNDAKAYMTAIRGVRVAVGDEVVAFKAVVGVIPGHIQQKRELAQVTNRYSESQTRIKQLMLESGVVIDDVTLKEWEQTKITSLLADQVNKTGDDFQAWYDVLLGSAYGYAAHVEAIQQLKPLLDDYGLAIKRIPEEKWLQIQRWDPQLATNIVDTVTTLLEMNNLINKFEVTFPDLLRLANVEGTIVDIDRVKEAITKLHEETGDEKYAKALEDINQHLGNVMQKEIEARRITTYVGKGAEFQRPTQVRLVDAETLKAYRENFGKLPAFTDLAKGLGKTADTVLSLVDASTGEILRLEENTLALEMLGHIVGKNTTVQEKRLEAEYNLPSGYQRPGRNWYYQTTGSGEFGPMQESLWGMWEEFVKGRSMQTGGVVPQTGAYFLHKKETVVSGDGLNSTNSILSNACKTLEISQSYLSSINIGIVGVRQELSAIRELISNMNTGGDGGFTEIKKMTKASYVGVSSFGIGRR